MIKVLDASAWVAAWRTPRLEQAGLSQAVVPGHFEADVHSVRGLVRGRVFSRTEGDAFVAVTSAAPFVRVPASELIVDALPLSEAVPGYDAIYVALARREGVPLLTADARLARGAGGLCAVELLRA